jgi:peptidyl-prolyl cis-trans isomerase SurA
MRNSILVFLGVVAAFSAGCKSTVPANVAAQVNGLSITYAEVDKQYKRQFANQPEGTLADQMQMQKLELLRAMIDEKMLLQRAEKLGLLAKDDEVETRLNQFKAPYTAEEFQKQLDAQQMALDELKARIRTDLSIEKLMNKEIISRINISDKDVNDFYNANKAAFRFAENTYHLAQIVVTAAPSSEVKNLAGSKAQNEEQARKKIQMIEAQLKQGQDFGRVAQALSEDPQSAANGGDMGFIQESNLTQADPETRKAIMTMTPGQVTAPIKIGTGWRILKLIAREPAGQRELTDPAVQQNIREALRTRKEQLLRIAYIDACRNESRVMNFMALSLAPGFEKK